MTPGEMLEAVMNAGVLIRRIRSWTTWFMLFLSASRKIVLPIYLRYSSSGHPAKQRRNCEVMRPYQFGVVSDHTQSNVIVMSFRGEVYTPPSYNVFIMLSVC